MTKKDFIALADAIREHNAAEPSMTVGGGFHCHPFTQDQVFALSQFCMSQNPAFMRSRWFDYIAGTCGKNGGKK